jgi:hypothetical protein
MEAGRRFELRGLGRSTRPKGLPYTYSVRQDRSAHANRGKSTLCKFPKSAKRMRYQMAPGHALSRQGHRPSFSSSSMIIPCRMPFIVMVRHSTP